MSTAPIQSNAQNSSSDPSSNNLSFEENKFRDTEEVDGNITSSDFIAYHKAWSTPSKTADSTVKNISNESNRALNGEKRLKNLEETAINYHRISEDCIIKLDPQEKQILSLYKQEVLSCHSILALWKAVALKANLKPPSSPLNLSEVLKIHLTFSIWRQINYEKLVSIKELNLSGKKLNLLPKELSFFTHLETLDISDNLIAQDDIVSFKKMLPKVNVIT